MKTWANSMTLLAVLSKMGPVINNLSIQYNDKSELGSSGMCVFLLPQGGPPGGGCQQSGKSARLASLCSSCFCSDSSPDS